jgi:hypothetical protein
VVQNAKEGASEKMVECIKRMYDEIQFCVKWSYEEVTEAVKQEAGVRHGYSLNTYRFNIYIHIYMWMTF